MDEQSNSQNSFKVDHEAMEVVQMRVFDAPRELVYQAHVDPTLVVQWWGPRSTKTMIDKMDVKVGGEWRFTHKDDNGDEYGFNGVYKEVVPNEKLTRTFNFEPIGPGHELVETVLFEDVDGKTRVTTISKYSNVEDMEGMVGMGMEEGSTESMDRLGELLEKK